MSNIKATVGGPDKTWGRTARNLAIDEYRHEQISARYLSDMQGCERDLDEAPLQDEVFAARARLAQVTQGLEQLPVRTKYF